MKIKRILETFKGLKYIPRIKAGGKVMGISRMLISDGSYVSDKDGIAEAFATFYEALY